MVQHPLSKLKRTHKQTPIDVSECILDITRYTPPQLVDVFMHSAAYFVLQHVKDDLKSQVSIN